MSGDSTLKKSINRAQFFLMLTGLGIYLVFVWCMAYIRRDYIWFIGDSPNLLQQSILMSKGFIPNVDFLSGYPGLSIQIHAIIISLIGYGPLSHQVYIALLATVLGFIFFWVLRDIQPWLLTLSLLFIYADGFYINQTPNPGYLFVLAFIVGLKKTIDFFNSHNLVDALLAGFFFSLAFLAKQYGIFGPICFFIATTAFLECRPTIQKWIFALALMGVSGAILYFYINGLIPTRTQNSVVVNNALLFSVPTIAALAANFSYSQRSQEKPLPFSLAIKANLLVTGIFAITTATYLIGLYGFNNLLEVGHRILVEAPRRVNLALTPVTYSFSSTIVICCALLILLSPFIFHLIQNKLRNNVVYFIFSIIACLLLLVIFESASPSASLYLSPFIVIAFVALLIAINLYVEGVHRKIILAVISGIAPYMLILTPWPCYSYHTPILVFFALIALSADKNNIELPRMSLGIKLIPYSMLLAVACYVLVICPYNYMENKEWTFNELRFVSGDPRWKNVIDEASLAMQGKGGCSTYGCLYLVFSQPWKQQYLQIIQKP